MHVRTFPAAGRLTLVTAALAATLIAVLAFASAARAEFGIAPGSFKVDLSTTQAGAPVDLTTSFAVNTEDNNGVQQVSGTLRDLAVDLPPGLIGDPTAVPRCTEAQFVSATCPLESQVGVLTPTLMFFGTAVDQPAPIYNLVPGKGETARLGANAIAMVHMFISVRDDGDYGLHTEVHNLFDMFGVVGTKVELWGVPSDSSHDTQRPSCLQLSTCPVASPAPHLAFMRNSSSCGAQADARLAVSPWLPTDPSDAATASLPDITGCDKLPPAKANVSFSPDSHDAGAPTGMGVRLDVPRVDDPDAPWTPPLKTVSIALPDGVAISPGSADGLQACTDAELHQHDDAPVACPAASKIGTVTITTPLLPDPLTGSMYLGTPQPGNQFRLFLAAEGSGVHIRLRGSAVPDAQGHRLVTTFQDLPPLPFSELEVDLKGGSRAVLVNPPSCGHTGGSVTVAPVGGGADAMSTTSMDVTGACSSAFAPGLIAGTTVPSAGADSPFELQISRGDGQQDLNSIAVDLPAGLIGKVAGIPLCPTAAAVSGTCSDASKVGSVTTTVGTGPHPISLPGSVYLTEGYGGPFGLDFVVPAKIGPFDFGNVVVRAKVQVDAFSGALHVQTDPLPSVIAGIPLHYRSVQVNLDRAGFMRNPTSCLQQQITASLTSATGTVATPATRFQVAGCAGLPLAPKIRMTLNGPKEKKVHGKPGFSFLMKQTAGQSNLQAVAVTLPKQVGIALGLPTPCTLAQFQARNCPEGARIGDSWVTTPLLDGRLQGGVYVVDAEKSGGLPRLGVLLDGQVPISLLSRISFAHGHVTTTFLAPDLPISAFKLALRPHTALETAKSLCTRKPKAHVSILGASGARYRKTIKVPAQGCPYGHHHHKGHAARTTHGRRHRAAGSKD